MSATCHGICNYCGRLARKRERSTGWATVRIGVTELRMHHECAQEYHDDGLLPGATFQRRSDSLRERINRAMSTEPVQSLPRRRRQPEGELWFGSPNA